MENKVKFRTIQQEDNETMAAVIRSVMTNYGAVGSGFSIEDPEVDGMSEAYSGSRAIYYVYEKNGKIIGGAGLDQLAGASPEICELKKMYFLPEARGLGLGNAMAKQLIEDARKFGYKQMYLETLNRMVEANKLYKKLGFLPLERHLGNTGHCGCDAYYLMDL